MPLEQIWWTTNKSSLTPHLYLYGFIKCESSIEQYIQYNLVPGWWIPEGWALVTKIALSLLNKSEIKFLLVIIISLFILLFHGLTWVCNQNHSTSSIQRNTDMYHFSYTNSVDLWCNGTYFKSGSPSSNKNLALIYCKYICDRYNSTSDTRQTFGNSNT